jgi:hypothetical protein
MFGFSSKIYCVLKEKKVKEKSVKSCHDFSLVSTEGNSNPMDTLFNEKYVPTCKHCFYNKEVGFHPTN